VELIKLAPDVKVIAERWRQRIASEAYAAADAMLAERDKPAGVAVKDVHDSQTHGGLL